MSNSLPDVSFAEKDIETILNDMITGYEEAYLLQTGEVKKLYPGDPIRVFLYSQALRELQLRYIIDAAAKQNLLKYAQGQYLDLKGDGLATRIIATRAKAAVKFVFSAALPVPQTIPKGTRIVTGNEVYFETTEDISAASGLTEISAPVTCMNDGTIGNGFTPGQINTLVDPLPWVASVVNTETSSGGADVENDESYRERIRLAPESFSVAGPSGAYEFFAKQYSSSIQDVRISSPSGGVVDIRILLQNGEIPSGAFLEGVQAYLSDKTRRPLTDSVIVNAPETVLYNINLTYYILSENAAAEAAIKANVEKAIQEYILWQKSKIGRAINQSELIARVIHAGAKRVNVVSPAYTGVSNIQVAIAGTVTDTYGGLEDA